MSNKSVSLKFFETYGNRHDVGGCGPLFADDAVIYAVTSPGPIDFLAYKQVGYAFLAGFADLNATVIEQLEDGNKVVNRVMWSGTTPAPSTASRRRAARSASRGSRLTP